MAEITASMVKELREMTGAGMMSGHILDAAQVLLQFLPLFLKLDNFLLGQYRYRWMPPMKILHGS